MIQNKAFENIFDDYILKKDYRLKNLILNDKKTINMILKKLFI